MTCIPDEWLPTTEPGLSASFSINPPGKIIFPLFVLLSLYRIGFFLSDSNNVLIYICVYRNGLVISVVVAEVISLFFSVVSVEVGKKWSIVGLSGEKWVFPSSAAEGASCLKK